MATAKTLFDSIPDDELHFFDRLGMESRLRAIRSELGSLESQKCKSAEAILYFYGAPVKEEGIDAKFSGDVLRAYQDTVSRQVAHIRYSNVARTGPVRGDKEHHLHITNVVHGSFGFELAELDPDENLLPMTPLAEAVETVSELMDAARQSDDQFTEAVAETSERVYAALGEFFSVVHKAGASFRLVTHSGERKFDDVAIRDASERTAAVRSDGNDEPIPGTFLGVLLDSRRFEHRRHTGEVIRGKLAPTLDASQLIGRTGSDCIAHVQVVTLTRGTRVSRSYTLTGIENPPPAYESVAAGN